MQVEVGVGSGGRGRMGGDFSEEESREKFPFPPFLEPDHLPPICARAPPLHSLFSFKNKILYNFPSSLGRFTLIGTSPLVLLLETLDQEG